MNLRNTLPMNDRTVESVMILWSRGVDTYDIAQQWMVTEAEVCRALTIGREWALARRNRA